MSRKISMSKKSKTRSVEIDFEIHQLIELEKQGFWESDNNVLRRLLGFDDSQPQPSPSSTPPPEGRSWKSHGVTLPHGTEIQMEYGGRQYMGEINSGRWKVEGRTYNSPSQAAGAVARTKSGARTHLNGWVYWSVKRPTDTSWVSIKRLREEAER